MGKPKLVCGCHKFLSHMFATDVKWGQMIMYLFIQLF